MYTLEVYKADRRRKTGERVELKVDYDELVSREDIEIFAAWRYLATEGYRWEIHETYVTRKNAISGEEYQERYDTPYYCSPSSETYWCM